MIKIIMFFIVSVYSFAITVDQANYEIIKSIKKHYFDESKNNGMKEFSRGRTIHDFDKNWIDGINSLKWELVTKLPQNGEYHPNGKKADNGIYVTKEIFDNKRVMMRLSNIGWRGYTYVMYYVSDDEYSEISKTLKDKNFKKTDDNLDKCFSDLKIIYPQDPNSENAKRLIYSPSSWVYRGGILDYKGYYYFFKGDDFDNTRFTLVRLSQKGTEIICKFATPSFKYRDDFTDTEKLIWGSGELSELDSELGKLDKQSEKYLSDRNAVDYSTSKTIFLQNREDSNTNPDFMILLYKKRINIVKNLLENEKTKTTVRNVSVNSFTKIINGDWKTQKYISSSKDTASQAVNAEVNVKIDGNTVHAHFLKDVYKEKDIEKNYTITKVIKTNTLNARQNFTKHYQYGSLGGDIDLVPYYSKYYLVSLRDKETRNIVYMVYSTSTNGKSMLVFDPDYGLWNSNYYNIKSHNIWVTGGYLLTK